MQALWHDVLVCLCRRQFDIHCLMTRLSLCYQVGQRQIGIRTSHQVAVVVLQQVVLHTLSHAAQHANDKAVSCQLWAVSFLTLTPDGIQRVQTVENLLLGIVTYRTGIQEYGISFFQLFRCLVASHLHHGGYHLRVCHIHLASISLYIQFLHIRGKGTKKMTIIGILNQLLS